MAQKKRRGDFVSARQTRDAAVVNAPATLTSSPSTDRITGTKLDTPEFRQAIAAHPDELKGTISEIASEMLDLVLTIKQREKSHARFANAHEDNPFIPNSFRGKCPIRPSELLKDDNEITAKLAEADYRYKTYQLEMSKMCADISKLEITGREKLLHKTFYDGLKLIAECLVVVKATKDDYLPTGHNTISQEDIALSASEKAILNLQPSTITLFHHTSTTNMCAEFARHHAFTPDRLHVRLSTCAEANEFSGVIEGQLQALLPGITTALWSFHFNKDKMREQNSQLKSFIAIKKQNKANEDVAMALDEETPANPAIIQNMIDKKVGDVIGKEISKMKGLMRKKYSGDSETQELQPEKNGPKSRKPSRRSRSRSRPKPPKNNNNIKNTKAPNSIMKKSIRWKRDDTPPPKQRGRSRSKNSRGNQDASNNSVKRRGARKN